MKTFLIKLFKNLSSGLATVVIPLSFLLSYFVYDLLLGSPSNFEGGVVGGQPLPGNFYGIIYKGGFIVIVLLAFAIILITFVVERLLVLMAAGGKGNINEFIVQIRTALDEKKIEEAKAICDQQKGTVANVIKSGLITYAAVLHDEHMFKDQKIAAIQKNIDETANLELPVLENNLIIISTLSTIATLYGLLGTVTGIIKSFAALARVGAPDAVGLANGISEALTTTAIGIVIGSFAVIFYNFFSSKITAISHKIDEAEMVVVNAFNKNYSTNAENVVLN
ncbi:MAG: MotA/TolQ/ExbB proton channel family protein [Cytophagales bacterium]